MISVSSTGIRSAAFVFAGSLLCAAAQASTQTPHQHIDANWANPPAPVAAPQKRVDLDSLPPAPPVTPREEHILPRSESITVKPMKAPDRRCDPGLDALFLTAECGRDPSWLGQHKNPTKLHQPESPNAKWMREQKELLEQGK